MSQVILLVDKPGYLRDAWRGLVTALPGEPTILLADTGLLALKVLRETPPHLTLLGSGLLDAEVIELVRCLKQAQPGAPCLVLTNNPERPHPALAAGADQIFSMDLPSAQVFKIMLRLLAV